tara:strand:+ start:18115 stop:21000 length:2886 start_codon:yes stop_codon:yes gene_type:complete
MNKKKAPVLAQAQNEFLYRHIGASLSEQESMLDTLEGASLHQLMQRILPQTISLQEPLNLPSALNEEQALARLAMIAKKNKCYRNLIGAGYYATKLPHVIARNVLENPAWYTAYTPYQAEIAQGRMEALLNFQQVTMDLTGLDLACASLLDEAHAAAEAMMLAYRMRKDKSNQCFFMADDVFSQVQAVVKTRAEHLGIELIIAPKEQAEKSICFGALFQQSNHHGELIDLQALIESVKQHHTIVAVACDWMALMLLRSPGELGADIAFGSSQRFGVPMGYGGPHAAFFAARMAFKRSMPGRIIGVSKDGRDQPALRMAMQTREQHIRREKASSNICTAQVLLANLASFYAVYHGEQGLKNIAKRIHACTDLLALGLKEKGIELMNQYWFDTLTFKVQDIPAVLKRADSASINLRQDDHATLGLSLDELSDEAEVEQLWSVILGVDHGLDTAVLKDQLKEFASIPASWLRTDAVLQHPTFQKHQSETQMLRYIKYLEKKDLALDQAMIPLGSCTMKLNATAQMLPISWPEFAHMHPFCPLEQAQGYQELIEQLSNWLCQITGFDQVSLQPNSGAQGEYAGLLAIKHYLASIGQAQRDVCLIPQSAHGTNPASATMVGMKVATVACDTQGNIDLHDLEDKVAQHQQNLACLMITYPSTHGVFEEQIVRLCQMIHDAGGQVYLDGANMNAQVGLTSPAFIGADVSHLNLHKTFAIPHGGGGPGVGPIGVKQHLVPFLPTHDRVKIDDRAPLFSVSAAPWGSAGILPISWMYLALLGQEGVLQSTQVAILNANYICKRLAPHYPILYKGESGYVAHEGIIDLRPFKESAGITELDVAKRLIDYGFHAPTMSFPVAGTLMVEPTESESKQEIDDFIDAMIAIRQEIKQIEEGVLPQDNNPLVFAPHTMADLVASDFDERSYSREQGAFPSERVKRHKIWPSVNRLDDAYGDRRLCCHCIIDESSDS